MWAGVMKSATNYSLLSLICCKNLFKKWMVLTLYKVKPNTVEALLTDTLVSGQLYLQPPSQNPVLLNPHTNSVFSRSRKRPAPVTDTFLAPRGCPLTRASTVLWAKKVSSNNYGRVFEFWTRFLNHAACTKLEGYCSNMQ